MVKVSVIIPVFNVEDYLNQSLNSVVNQTLEDIEILCVNDGSTDNSLNILNDFAKKDSRIKIFSQENQGVSIARNNALKKASGDYVYFFDADDYICPQGLEKLYLNATNNDSDISIFKAMVFSNGLSDAYESHMCLIDSLYPDANFNNRTFTHRDIKEFILNTPQMPWNKLFKKEFLDKYEDIEFPPNLPYNDIAFHVKSMLRASKISFVPEFLYYYRKNNPNSISNDNSNHIKIFDIIRIVEDFLIKENFIEEYKKELEYFKIDHISYHLRTPLSKDYYLLAREEFEKINVEDNDLLKSLNLDKYYAIMSLPIDELDSFEEKLNSIGNPKESSSKEVFNLNKDNSSNRHSKSDSEKNMNKNSFFKRIKSMSFKEKLLERSNSFTYYKKGYEKLLRNNKKLKKEHKKELNSLRKKTDTQISSLKKNHENEINSLKDGHENEINSLKDGHENEINSLKEEQIKNIDSILNCIIENQEDLSCQLNLLKNEFNQGIGDVSIGSPEINDVDLLKVLLYHEFDLSLEHINICPICGEISAFKSFGDPLREFVQCPNCNSLERDRLSYILLKNRFNEYFKKSSKILHFAPEEIFYKIFKENQYIDYYPVDFDSQHYEDMGRPVRKEVNMENIPYEDNTFDLIYNSHVLEHVPDDIKAMKELYRVLKEDGVCIIVVPIYPISETLEKEEYNTPELRLKYYGQVDHLRKYGLDFKERLLSVGFNIEPIKPEDVIDFSQEKDIYMLEYGEFDTNGGFFVCTK